MTLPEWKRRNDRIDYAARIRAIRETEPLCKDCQCDSHIAREDLGTMPMQFTPAYRNNQPLIVNMDLVNRGQRARVQPRDGMGKFRSRE